MPFDLVCGNIQDVNTSVTGADDVWSNIATSKNQALKSLGFQGLENSACLVRVKSPHDQSNSGITTVDTQQHAETTEQVLGRRNG